MARDLQSQLDDVLNAIVAISTGGATVRSGGREVTMANLKDLRDTADWLEKKIQAQSTNGGSMCSLGVQGPLR